MRTEHVVKEFGGLVAVNDVSLDIPPHSIVSIIGPNGAGKTTLFNMLTGLYKPTSGRITLRDRDITRSRPDVITRRGVARTFQNIRLFGAMTALENVIVGRHSRMRAGICRLDPADPAGPSRGARGTRTRPRAARLRRAAARMCSSSSPSSSPTATSAGSRSRARSPPTRSLLLLDEPTAGMNPQESDALTDFMRKLRDELELTILLIEHDMKVVMDVSERVTVLDYGRRSPKGRPRRCGPIRA